MKKYPAAILLLYCLFFSLTALTQAISWYKPLTGTIGNSPFTMHLHKMGHTYSGYYHYPKTQFPVYFIGNDTVAGEGRIRLFAFLPDQPNSNEVFTFSLVNDQLSGEWQKDTDSKPVALSGKVLETGKLNFDMIFTAGTEKLRPAMKEQSPEAGFEAAAIWPKETTPAANFIRKLVNEAFGAKNSLQPVGKHFLANKARFFKDFLAENRDVADSEMVAYPYAFNQEETQHLMIVYQAAGLLTLANWNYTYMGGAHGNYGTGFIVADLVSKRKLVLKDVLTTAATKPLQKLLEQNFRKQYAVTEKESLEDAGLFVKTIAPNDNFYLTGKGIGFSYAPYEIGPYAMGEIHLFIPYTALQQYLQAGFKKRMSL